MADYAQFDGDQYSFYLTRNPFPGETIHAGPYRLGKNVEDANTYRVGHPLAQRVLAQAMALDGPPAEVVFDYSGSGKNVAALTRYVGQGGWLTCSRLEIRALEVEDALILSGFTDKQEPLDETACHRLFDLPGDCPDFRPTKMGLSPSVSGSPTVPTAMQGLLTAAAARRQAELLDTLMAKNSQWFDAEVNKLYRWSEDVKLSLETEIKDLDKEIRELRRASVLAQSLQDKLTFQKEIRELERRRTGKRRDLFNAQDAVDAKREDLIGKVEEKLKQTSSVQPLFTIRWRVQ